MIYPWQQTVYEQLVANVYANKLHHALLFSAADGMGADALLDGFAAFLLCQSPQNGVSCGQCKTCHLLASETHSDLLKISPSGSSIGVDEVRKITQFCQASCMHSNRKVVIINGLDLLTESAANALLKTLEEPNAGRYILMLADDVSRLFATVLSRCLVYTLTVDSQNAANYLARLNIDNNYAWIMLFGRQPLLIEKWCVERKLDKLNQLYVVCQNIINGQDETDELKSLLSVEPQLVDIIGVFFASLLNKALLNKQINLTKYTQMQHNVTEFINLCRLAKGTNFQLQCQSLVINLQK